MSETPIIDHSWTLFLDRDGTINKRLIGDYVKKVEEFEFLPHAKEGVYLLSQLFERVLVVTNQQCIGKEIITHDELYQVHRHMMHGLEAAQGRVDQLYYCPHLATLGCSCRKPGPGMGLQAKQDYPEIDFKKCMMVGDTASDMAFGKNLGMYTVLVLDGTNQDIEADLHVSDLKNLASYLQ